MKKMAVLFLFASSAALAAEELRHVYRLDFAIAERDTSNALTSKTYTMNIEERHNGEIKVGTNVALPGKNPARADIGLALRASVSSTGDALLVDDEIEISNAKDASSFRKMSTRGNALVVPGTPALVASVEDPFTRTHYEVTVTATKLR